jgi:BirA family transcriptional regulator, biotin operon repressor / biotin---[acetyl-CoA-carboxylase] ligase
VIPKATEQDGLDVAAVAARVGTRWLARRHIHVATCSSTNDLAAAEARNGAPEGLLVTADEQTGGRGRLGRIWHSPPGANLYFSLLLRPERPATEIPPLTLLVGGALAAAVRQLGFDADVKWPNDILLRTEGRGRKVAGILTEASTEGHRMGHVVVGIGVNVNTRTFPEELRDKATSLQLAGGAPLDRTDVLCSILTTIESAYERFRAQGPAAAIALWESHADLGNRCRARTESREIEGVTAGIAADGALLIRDDHGTVHRIVSGEVVAVEAPAVRRHV